MFRQKNIIILILAAICLAVLIAVAYYVVKKKFKFLPRPAQNIVEIDSERLLLALDKPNILFIDFEDFESNGQISDAQFYSGTKSCKVEGKNSFSPVVKKSVADIGLSYMTRVGASAFVYIKPDNIEKLDARLVVSITDESGNNIFWEGVPLSGRYMTPHKWIKISSAFDIQQELIQNAYFVNVYLWNNSRTTIYIDDILVVFGKDEPLRGDTTYNRVSRNGFALPPPNHPPFEPLFTEQENVNAEALMLLSDVMKNTGHEDIDLLVLSGNFFMTHNQLDKLVFLHQNKLMALAYCSRDKRFEIFEAPEDDALAESWQNGIKQKGLFSSSSRESILIADTMASKVWLIDFDDTVDCTHTERTLAFTKKSFEMGTFMYDNANPVYWHAFTRNALSEILCVYGDGRWQLFSFANGIMQKTAPTSEGRTQNLFRFDGYGYKIVSGKLMQGKAQKVMLELTTNEATPYRVLNFNASGTTLSNVMQTSASSTYNKLHPSQKFLHVKGPGGQEMLLYFDNSWRYDLKLISLSDTSCNVLRKIEYLMRSGKRNPKYYEMSGLLAGHFVSTAYTSLISINTNCRSASYNGKHCDDPGYEEGFPDAVYIFGLKGF